MKLKSVRISDFKRFTDLSVQGIPATARLVMLAGPNGSGKSSFFDALYTWRESRATRGVQWDIDYHVKGGDQHPVATNWKNQVTVTFHDYEPSDPQTNRKTLYFRSAYRNDPEFQAHQFRRAGDPLDDLRIRRMIDNDAAVSGNYQKLVGNAVEDVFENASGSTTLEEFRKQVTRDIAVPFSRLFPDLEFNSLGNPFADGTFRFTKGTSRGFPYKNLSGGEKAVFDLVLDLVVSRHSFDNTVFCIDEPESHMNTRVQAELVSVLYDLIPEPCQLVLATHSVGMMRRARDIEEKNPGSVAFLDFGDRDFDASVVIEPTIPDRSFWNTIYEVALDDLASLVAPELVVICEGEPRNRDAGQNFSHDARCYDRIFETTFPGTQFIPGGGSKDVENDKRGIAYAIGVLTQGCEVIRLIDRDAHSPDEVNELKQRGVRVLSRRNLESYLFDDEVLKALADSVGRQDKANELLTAKKDAVAASPNGAADDLKPASGTIYNECKEILGLTNPGNDKRSFMRDTLAPLVKPGMTLYEQLKKDIFGP